MRKPIFISGHIFIIVITLMIISSSCSLVENSRRSLLGDPKEAAKQPPKYVSKAQYDQLMQKYEKLSDKYDQSASPSDNPPDQVPSMLNTKADQSKTKESQKPVEKASSKSSSETVDVFENIAQKQKASQEQSPAPMIMTAAVSTEQGSEESRINEEAQNYNRAVALLQEGDNQRALRAFQVLSKSGVFQVRVRAKYQMGQIFMSNNDYDLALQVFEEILTQDASSGIVLDALQSLVRCSEQLNLQDKKDKYSTILRDIFGLSQG